MDSRPKALTPGAKAKLVAALWHSLGLLIILLAICWGLLRMQSRSLAAGEQHHGNVEVYLSVIASERRRDGEPLRLLWVRLPAFRCESCKLLR